jgi:hypothetical protein
LTATFDPTTTEFLGRHTNGCDITPTCTVVMSFYITVRPEFGTISPMMFTSDQVFRPELSHFIARTPQQFGPVAPRRTLGGRTCRFNNDIAGHMLGT